MTSKKTIATSLLILDPRLQCRDSVPEALIKEYEDLWREKVTFPPVQAFEVDGQLLVVDGFCRVLAAQNVGKSRIEATVTKGTFQDALRAACGANASHGHRRTQADKRKAAGIAIAEFPDETSRVLAAMVGVSHTYIVSLREKDKKLDAIIDQAAAGVVPELTTKPKPKPEKPPTKPDAGIPVPGWKCSDCAGVTQVLTDGGYACSACLCPVGDSVAEPESNPAVEPADPETDLGDEDPFADTNEKPGKEPGPLETFTDPDPEKLGAVHTAWGRFIRACEQANCSHAIKVEIEAMTKKLKGLQ